MLDIQIETEVVVTLVAALVTTLIVIFQIQRNALRRARLKHSIELLELATGLKCDAGNFDRLVDQRFEGYVEKKRRRITVGVLCGIIFWVALFAAFSWWTFFLINQGFIVWAPLAGLCALCGLVMSFSVWNVNRRANKEINRLIRGIDAYQESLEKQEKESKEREARLRAAEAKAKQEAKAKAEAEEVRPVKIPEDSMLRRHFLTNMRAEIESGMPPRPTDFALRRHHDAMINVELEKRLGGQLSELRVAEERPRAPAERLPTVEARVKHEVEEDRRVNVPEDSALRRHFLTNLRSEIESGMPPRPTDSALRRHHDAMIDAEVEKRLAGDNA